MFSEREENVKADIFHAYITLLKQTRPQISTNDPDAMEQGEGSVFTGHGGERGQCLLVIVTAGRGVSVYSSLRAGGAVCVCACCFRDYKVEVCIC